jgi:ABC-2 type transport system permease protein
MRAIKALIIKEFIAVLQDAKSRMVLIISPLVQLVILSSAATLDVTDASIGIFNRDHGLIAKELVHRFEASPIFSRILFFDSLQELQKNIENQTVTMALHFDSEFSRRWLSQENAPLQIILDGRKSNSAQILNGYALQIIERFEEDQRLMTLDQRASPQLIPRYWYNPNLIYSWFTVPGLIGILSMVISLILTSMAVARERELGTFDQLLVAPLRPMTIVIGKTIPAITLAMLEASLILFAGIYVFFIPFTGSFLLLYLAMFFFILSTVGIGLFLSSICKTQQQGLLVSFVFISPAIILSGYATPIESIPEWLQFTTRFNPLYYYLIIIRGCFLKQLPFHEVMSRVYPIIGIAFFNFLFSCWFFKKRLD